MPKLPTDLPISDIVLPKISGTTSQSAYYGDRTPRTPPLPEYIGITPASEHDLKAFRRLTLFLRNCGIYADMAYTGTTGEQFPKERGNVIHTPVKKKKGQQDPGLSEQLFPTYVSRIRQPTESLFNRIQEKTDIQTASKVRSYKGLTVHVFGRLAAAMFMMVFNY